MQHGLNIRLQEKDKQIERLANELKAEIGK